MCRRVQCAADKQAWLSRTWQEALAAGSALQRCVYVGDSVSDLGALTCADVGIVVGSNRVLARVLAAAGIQLRPPHEGKSCHMCTGFA